MIKFIPISGPVDAVCADRLVSTTRTSWMANNAIPDSIIMNMICRSLLPPVELDVNEPNDVRSTDMIGLNSKNTLSIFNTIRPVIRAFTTMDMAKPVRTNVYSQGVVVLLVKFCSVPIAATQRTIDDKLGSA
jgi:hypothetical protein